MDLMAGIQGFRKEENQVMKGTLPSSRSPSSSSSSSSTAQNSRSCSQLLPLMDVPARWSSAPTQERQLYPWVPTRQAQEKPQEEQEQEEEESDATEEASPGNEGGTVRIRSRGADSEREHMFDKVVTPSDVGKLNRLVIPKQHAEKYFPLDCSTHDKGLLLNFEDRTGKPWRFRYSYWNSSQSYVMTKGWSRFVKDKKLDAGDIVSFQRGLGESGNRRLYIDWRRRPDAPDPAASLDPTLSLPHHFSLHSPLPWTPLFLRPPAAAPAQWAQQPSNKAVINSACSNWRSVFYVGSTAPQQVGMVQLQQGGAHEPMVLESVPVVQGKAAEAKRLIRLFGVNMECPIPGSDECDMLASTSIPHAAAMPSQSSPVLSSSSLHPLQLRLYSAPNPSTSLDVDILNK